MLFIEDVELKTTWHVVCDLGFIPLFLLQVEKLMRKKQLDVADFSVYWDTNCTLLGDLPPGQLQVQERDFACEREIVVVVSLSVLQT